jgi:hypothetical protein
LLGNGGGCRGTSRSDQRISGDVSHLRVIVLVVRGPTRTDADRQGMSMQCAVHRQRLLTALLVAVAFVAAAISAPAAVSAGPEDRSALALACPDGEVPAAGFTDAPGAPHGEAVDCLTWWELTPGHGDGTYRPQLSVTRGQMATFISNLMRVYADQIDGVRLPTPAPASTFPDVAADHPHAEGILTVAAVSIARGIGDGRFGPQEPVTRAQMATLLTNLHEWATIDDLRRDETTFSDVAADSPHHDAISGLAHVGVVRGVGGDRYRPSGDVTRAAMASFLMRQADLMAKIGYVLPPGTDDEEVLEGTTARVAGGGDGTVRPRSPRRARGSGRPSVPGCRGRRA